MLHVHTTYMYVHVHVEDYSYTNTIITTGRIFLFHILYTVYCKYAYSISLRRPIAIIA
jgi:hypothetical protein